MPSTNETSYWERPCADNGLLSYRCKGSYGGYIMIGAKDDADAMREAYRSTNAPHDLELWNGSKYEPVFAGLRF